MDTYTAFERAIASTEGVIKGLRSPDLDAATPCTEWSVRDLLNHVVGTLWLASGLFADRTPRHAVAPGGLPDGDLVGDRPAEAYAEAAAAALDAAAIDGTFERVHSTPAGDMPGAALAGFTTMDVLVHGWDLATATGQDLSLDDDLVAAVMAFARQAITDDRRAPLIGPAVRPAKKASATDKLVAFLGRTP